MEIIRVENGRRGTFFIEKDGERVAEMTYKKAGKSRIYIDHTEVGESMRGTGAGKKLVLAGVEFARESGLKLVPVCPFAKAVIDKNPDLQDVL